MIVFNKRFYGNGTIYKSKPQQLELTVNWLTKMSIDFIWGIICMWIYKMTATYCRLIWQWSVEDGDKNKSNSKEMFYAKMLIQKSSETGDAREY